MGNDLPPIYFSLSQGHNAFNILNYFLFSFLPVTEARGGSSQCVQKRVLEGHLR